MFTFKVRGRGAFPLDMLRYDMCWPTSSDDVAIIHRSLTEHSGWETASITSAKPRYGLPTYARWKSFGWAVIDENGKEIG